MYAVSVVPEFGRKVINNPLPVYFFVNFGNDEFVETLRLYRINNVGRFCGRTAFDRKFRNVVFGFYGGYPSIRPRRSRSGGYAERVFNAVVINVYYVVAICLPDCPERQQYKVYAYSIALFERNRRIERKTSVIKFAEYGICSEIIQKRKPRVGLLAVYGNCVIFDYATEVTRFSRNVLQTVICEIRTAFVEFVQFGVSGRRRIVQFLMFAVFVEIRRLRISSFSSVKSDYAERFIVYGCIFEEGEIYRVISSRFVLLRHFDVTHRIHISSVARNIGIIEVGISKSRRFYIRSRIIAHRGSVIARRRI